MDTGLSPMMPQTLAFFPQSIGLSVVIVVAVFFTIWIIFSTVDSMYKSHQRERTAREIAAYVAEGSISAAEAGHLLESQRRSNLRDRLADLVAEEEIDVETASKIMGDEGFSVTVRAGPARGGSGAQAANA